jgi:hypothetical protein
MSELDLGPIGIAVQVSADGGHLAEAAELEELGYSAIWLRGGQIDSLSRITEVVRATTAVPVIPGIIPVDVYGPGEVIQLYADLQARAPGRVIAGLGGPQVPWPLGPLNDYLDQLDQGDPPVPAGRRILAALGPRKLEIARDRAAGAVLRPRGADTKYLYQAGVYQRRTPLLLSFASAGDGADQPRNSRRHGRRASARCRTPWSWPSSDRNRAPGTASATCLVATASQGKVFDPAIASVGTPMAASRALGTAQPGSKSVVS